jgi:serine protease Do
VTAGHCVDANSFAGGKGAILEAHVEGWNDYWVSEFGYPLNGRQMARLRNTLRANATVEGYDAGSPPDRTVTVRVPSLSGKSYPASVSDVQSFNDGDVALLQATGLEAPILTVADAAPESGDSVVAAGFAGGVAEVVDARTPPSFNEGSVSGTETVNGTPFTQISARTSAGMSGGPVLNMDGDVVGTVSWAPVDSDTSADFMTARDSLHSILSSNGVDTTLTPANEAYRQGLTYYSESRYHDAVAAFDEALALQPEWGMVSEHRQDAVANYPSDVNPPGLATWIYIVAGGVGLAAAAALGVVLMRRRRARPSEEAPAVAPTGIPPQPAMETTAPAPERSPGVGRAEPPATPVTPVGRAAPGAVATAEPSTQTQLFCPNCGARHEATAHYCEKCGQPFAIAMPEEHDQS